MDSAASAAAAASATAPGAQQLVFDENAKSFAMNLMSRTMAVYGQETMTRLLKMRVLIVGLGGVGTETAKNLVLAGPGSVTVFDNTVVSIADLGTNFYLTPAHVGKRRSVSVRDALAQLNTFVDVQAHTGELNEAFISNFHAVVVTDAAMPRKDLVRFSAFCHSRRLPHLNPQSGQQELLPAPIAFFYAVTRGVTASLFVDLGPEHTVTDADGQPVKSHVVEHISRSGVVTIGGGKDQHGLDDGDLVRFEEVQGMEALNKMEPIPIKRIKVADKKRTRVVGDRFQLAPEGGEFKVAGEYVNGGIVTQVKRPVTVRFEPLEQQLVHPALLPHMDSSRAGTDAVAQLHIAQLALFEFAEKSGGLPRLHSDEDAKQCVALAQDVLRAHKAVQGAVTVEAVDAKVVTNMALFARAELTGLCAFLGGIVAQEVIKVPGKFSPIRQWFHHDQFQLVPNGVPPDAAPQKSRYDHQIAIFGRAAHAKLCSQKWFVVGAGALGCEYLKGFALMGVGSGKGGALIVTDMDTVEISNLSRQFLFRKDNVGKPKSVSAAGAVKKMNPDVNIQVFETAVGSNTEGTFTDAFWDELSGVCNALDNIKARRYTCGKCVLHLKPLLESGTLGTMANNEVVIPHRTDVYNEEERKGEEDMIASCTIRNFPHFIEHCIVWARSSFTNLFETPAQTFNKFVQDRDGFFRTLPNEGNTAVQRERLESVQRLLKQRGGVTFERCVEMAFEQFHAFFRDRVQDLTHLFPKDSRTRDGSLFWSGHKRFPQALELNLDNPTHLGFIVAAANLFAFTFGVPQVRDVKRIRAMASALRPPKWSPPTNADLSEYEEKKDAAAAGPAAGASKEKEKPSDEEAALVQALIAELGKVQLQGLSPMRVAAFEKDDDDNFHMDFVAAASNLRASNYHIKEASRHQVKLTAGKIIPAVATATAMIAGLNQIELWKLVLGLDKKHFLNSNVNLAVNQLQAWEPSDPPRAKSCEFDVTVGGPVRAVPEGFTPWDKVAIDAGDLTVAQLIDVFKQKHHGAIIQHLAGAQVAEGKGQFIFSTSSFGNAELAARYERAKSMLVQDAYASTHGQLPPARRMLVLDATCVDEDDADLLVPEIKYIFKTAAGAPAK